MNATEAEVDTKALDPKALEAAHAAARAAYESWDEAMTKVGFTIPAIVPVAEAAIRAYLSTLQVQTSEAVPIHDFTTTNPKETTMPKLTSKIAIQLVERIEALNDQIHAVYREAGEYDGTNNINLIREIVDARAAVADSKVVAEGLLESLDLPDNDA